MVAKPAQLYIDLLKNTLAFTLWPEPPQPMAPFAYLLPPHKRLFVKTMGGMLGNLNIKLVQDRKFTEEQRSDGMIWPGYADSMIGSKRLDNIHECLEKVLADNVPGDMIETGVWRGGACILMRGILAAHGVTDRKVYVADSFAGLPEPDVEKYPADKDDQHHIHDFLAVSQEEVEANFEKYDLLDDQVVFLKGWFADTLPTAPIEALSLLRLDGDMYSSTMDTLDNMYDKLSSGGFCIIDDYGLEGCKKAVDDYRRDHGISEEIITVDWTGAYWRKA